MVWHDQVSRYGAKPTNEALDHNGTEADADDSEANILGMIVQKTVMAKFSALIASNQSLPESSNVDPNSTPKMLSALDPFSMQQMQNAIEVVENFTWYCEKDGSTYAGLMRTVEDRLLEAVTGVIRRLHLVIPRPPTAGVPSFAQDSARLDAWKQCFWNGHKLIRCILVWQHYLSDDSLKNLLLDCLVSKYVVPLCMCMLIAGIPLTKDTEMSSDTIKSLLVYTDQSLTKVLDALPRHWHQQLRTLSPGLLSLDRMMVERRKMLNIDGHTQ
jgi:hypothetical protein